MTEKYLKLDKLGVGIIKALNDAHSSQNYHPWTIEGQEGVFLSQEFLSNPNTPIDFKNYFDTLEIMEIPNAKIQFIDWNNYNSLQEEYEIRAAYNPYQTEILPDFLYHYTDANGLLGIITSRKVWATHYSFLNDYNEFDYAKKLIHQRVINLLEDNERNRVTKERWSLIEDWFKYLNTFLISFSTEHDRLSQWRGYSNLGKGYCLGFKTRIIGLATPPQKRTQLFTIRPVLYDLKEQLKIIDEIILHTYEEVNNYEHAQKSIGNFAYEFYKQLHWNSLLPLVSFKSPSFEEEKEWRAIHLQSQFDNLYTENLNVSFRVSGENIIPYIELDLNSEVGDGISIFPLREITFGPSINSVLATKSIKMILNKNKFNNVTIKSSNLTLR